MNAANLKVKSCLKSSGFEMEIQFLSRAVRTARLAADALGCDIGQIANSLIFENMDNGEAVLVMCSGGRRVNLQKVKSETGLLLSKADADFVRNQTGFVIGGVPPVAHKTELRTMIELSLQSYDEIWAAAGTADSIFRMSPQQLQEMTQGEWVDIAG
jgi:prolyl-tRNA editing enzyme YbaK/EbsC (Cys-tRNA(Pro) deacylase)